MDGMEWMGGSGIDDTLVMISIFCLFLAVIDVLSLHENHVEV